MAVVAPLLVVLHGQLVKQGTGEMGWEQERRWDENGKYDTEAETSRDTAY